MRKKGLNFTKFKVMDKIMNRVKLNNKTLRRTAQFYFKTNLKLIVIDPCAIVKPYNSLYYRIQFIVSSN